MIYDRALDQWTHERHAGDLISASAVYITLHFWKLFSNTCYCRRSIMLFPKHIKSCVKLIIGE